MWVGETTPVRGEIQTEKQKPTAAPPFPILPLRSLFSLPLFLVGILAVRSWWIRMSLVDIASLDVAYSSQRVQLLQSGLFWSAHDVSRTSRSACKSRAPDAVLPSRPFSSGLDGHAPPVWLLLPLASPIPPSRCLPAASGLHASVVAVRLAMRCCHFCLSARLVAL